MEIIDYEITYKSKKDKINLIGLGDIHLGHAGCDKQKLIETIEYIRQKPNCYWVGMGDYAECINVTDKRFDAQSVDPDFTIKDLGDLVKKQYEIIKKLLFPIRDKCIAILCGNHEETVRLKNYRDIASGLAEELKVRPKQRLYLGYSGFIRLKLKRMARKGKYHSIVYLIYAHHGWGSARTSGAKVNRLDNFTRGFDADLIMIAHEHKKIIAPPVTMLSVPLRGERRLIERKRIAVMTGGFLRGYQEGIQSYVERKGYNPSDLGVVRVILKCERHDIHASL